MTPTSANTKHDQTQKEAKGPLHTPGPWRVLLWDESGLVPPRVEQDCQPGRTFKSDTTDICYFPCHPLNKPNARLIAAAPDLLEACISALDTLSDQFHAEEGPTGHELRAAISKAEGESSVGRAGNQGADQVNKILPVVGASDDTKILDWLQTYLDEGMDWLDEWCAKNNVKDIREAVKTVMAATKRADLEEEDAR